MQTIDTLYIIDDDETYQFIAKRTIEQTTLVNTIKVFSTGLEAITFLKSAIDQPELLPEIILLDLTMPVMDGWGFLENYLLLKPRVGKTIYIYIVSSSINPSDVIKARNISEVTDYVVKPVTKEKFIELLKSIGQQL
ncbi:MAG: response regulator [Bacteroidota bacterium]